jgi:hypothetical protein
MTFALLAAPLMILAAPPPVASTAAADAPAAAVAEPPAPTSTVVPPDQHTAPNSIFFEAFGSGLLYSLNYERFIEKYDVGLRAGASFFTYAVSSYGSSGNLTLVSFPLVASYYLGWAKHKIQLGLGATVLYLAASSDSRGQTFDSERSGLGLAASGVVGYRYLPRDSGFTFGVGFTPLIRASKFLPWGGINAGYAF